MAGSTVSVNVCEHVCVSQGGGWSEWRLGEWLVSSRVVAGQGPPTVRGSRFITVVSAIAVAHERHTYQQGVGCEDAGVRLGECSVLLLTNLLFQMSFA